MTQIKRGYRVEAAYVLGGWQQIVSRGQLLTSILDGLAASPVAEVRVTEGNWDIGGGLSNTPNKAGQEASEPTVLKPPANSTAPDPLRDLAQAKEEQAAWLIERNSSLPRPMWWSGFGRDAWTFKADGAVRFARRVDAERVVQGFKLDAFVSEHLWMESSDAART